MMKSVTLKEKSDVANSHVLFDEGEFASEKPRRGSLQCKKVLFAFVMSACVAINAWCGESDVVKVKGVGTGASEELALKDAYRDAVESAVGTFVDAEQMVKNDEIIKDQILTQSNAYIEDYDILDKKSENGIVKIKILARVKKQELTKKIDGVMPAKTIKLGGELKKLHAVTTTQEKRAADAVALLSNAMNGVDPLAQLMEVSLASTESIQLDDSMRRGPKFMDERNDPNEVEVTYMFKFEINRDRYFKEFLPKMEQILEQISVEEPKPIAFMVERGSEDDRRVTGMDRALKFGYAVRDDARKLSVPLLGELSPMSIGSKWDRQLLKGMLQVAMVTDGDVDMRSVRGRRFVLDPAAAKFVYDRTDAKRQNDAPSCMVSFCDADGTVLVQQVIQPRIMVNHRSLAEMSFANLSRAWNGKMRQCVWLITPYMGTNAKAFYQRFTFKLPKDKLPKIDSIKIELVH